MVANADDTKARPSSGESAVIRKGLEGGCSSQRNKSPEQVFTGPWKSSLPSSGSVAFAQWSQHSSNVSNPSEPIPSLSAIHVCVGTDWCSHCSRSLASNTFTSFQSFFRRLLFSHSV